MNQKLKITAYTLLILTVLYLSVDIHSLDGNRTRSRAEVFDVEAFSSDIWQNQLPAALENVPDIDYLLKKLAENPEIAFNDYSNKIGISNTHYFLVKGKGQINAISEEYIEVTMGNNHKVRLTTLYIFGNAIREASGLVDISSFLNMMDFNMVSVNLNKKARTEIVGPLLNEARSGQQIQFTGALELNRLNMQLSPLSIIPLQFVMNHEH